MSTFQKVLLPGPGEERVRPGDHLHHRAERALPHRHAQDQAQSFAILDINVQCALCIDTKNNQRGRLLVLIDVIIEELCQGLPNLEEERGSEHP